jgi:hypothetical protein
VALSFLYSLIRHVLEMLRVRRMDAAGKDAEILGFAISSPFSAARSLVPASPGPPCRRRPPGRTSTPRALGIAPHAADNPRLAPLAGPQALDLPTPPTRSSVACQRDRGAHLPPGE